MCTHYGKIGGFWFDGNWSKPDADWKLDEFYGMIRRLQPDAIITNNTGLEAQGAIGHKEIDCVTFEQGAPTPLNYDKLGKYVAGEVSFPLNEHWSVAHDINYKPMSYVVKTFLACRRLRANMGMSIGPEQDGTLPIMQQAMLESLGEFVKPYGDLFFTSHEGAIKGTGNNYSLVDTQNNEYLVLTDLNTWGDQNVMRAAANGHLVFENVEKKVKEIVCLDNGEKLVFTQNTQQNLLYLPPVHFSYGTSMIARVAKVIYE